jgi:hypothetical protein
VDISYVEQDAEPTPAALSPDLLIMDNPVESTRITEGFELALTPIPSGKPTKTYRIQNSQDQFALSLPLAILQRKGKRWMVVRASQSKRIKKRRMKKRW